MERLGHASTNHARLLGILYTPDKFGFCILGKLDPEITDSSCNKLESVTYRDHFALISLPSYKYALLIDGATGHSWAYCVPDISSATTPQILKGWETMVNNQSRTTLTILCTDQAKEFTGIKTYLEPVALSTKPFRSILGRGSPNSQ